MLHLTNGGNIIKPNLVKDEEEKKYFGRLISKKLVKVLIKF